jgi:two-component system, OmpR family, KDP operon response regulator KdpE
MPPDDPATSDPVILHVEDEAPNLALLRAIASRAADPMVHDALLLEAGDLSTARALLAQRAVDLLLLDIRLPDGNGLDLAREVRAGDPTRVPAIIVMSASVLPTEHAAAIAAGADHFLAKPYDPSVLVSLMGERLRERRQPD